MQGDLGDAPVDEACEVDRPVPERLTAGPGGGDVAVERDVVVAREHIEHVDVLTVIGERSAAFDERNEGVGTDVIAGEGMRAGDSKHDVVGHVPADAVHVAVQDGLEQVEHHGDGCFGLMGGLIHGFDITSAKYHRQDISLPNEYDDPMAQRDVADTDPVDDLIDQWRHVRPDLEPQLAAMATIGRLGRLHAMIRPAVEAVLLEHGLGVADFDVLAALRRSGEPFVLRPSDLAGALMLSPAGITGRLDKLEQAGHITRRLDPDDRRSLLVELTESGLATVDAAVTDHVANEDRLLAILTLEERRTLDRILRKLTDARRDAV